MPRILRALDEAGWDGLYDIEIFSDDGTFGTAYDDSLWRLAPDAAADAPPRRLRAGWQARGVVEAQH